MKCEVIRDLLPLYIEDICSKESRELIEEHLSNCEDCEEYKENISKNILVLPAINEEKVQQFLSEKDLLKKSKQSIQQNFLKRALFIINILGIALTGLFFILGSAFLLLVYSAKYPAFHSETASCIEYFFSFILILLPVFIGLLQIFRIRKMKIKNYICGFVVNVLIQTFAVILSLTMTVCIFIIMPPLESQTQVAANYLIVDQNVEHYEEIYRNFFPHKIPKQAKEIDYFYSQYQGFFSNTVKIQASWVLPEAEYSLAKDTIFNNTATELIEGKENSYNVTLKGVGYPGKVNLIFQFNDLNKRVTYIFFIDNNI